MEMVREEEACKLFSKLPIRMRYIILSDHVQHETTLLMLIKA